MSSRPDSERAARRPSTSRSSRSTASSGASPRRACTQAIQLVQKAGHRCVIYTGKWFWEGRLGNPEWASHMPLWDSRYDGSATVAFNPMYGGWRKTTGKQYEGTNDGLGFSADLSVFDRSWLGA